MEHFTRKMINTILLCMLAIGVAAVIWDALPGIIKILTVGGVILCFFGLFEK